MTLSDSALYNAATLYYILTMGLAPRNTGLLTQAAATVAVLHHDPRLRKDAQDLLRALQYGDWPACISAKPLIDAYRNVLQRTPRPVYRAPSN